MNHFDVEAKIEQLFVYPIKSCAANQVQSAVLTEKGLQYDREWMVVDAETMRFVSQRELPRMVLVRPEITSDALVMNASGMASCSIPLNQLGEDVSVTVWDDTVPAFDMGDAAAAWLSQFLGKNLRLVRFDQNHDRVCSPKRTGEHRATTMFADGYPILVTSSASIDDLNDRLLAQGASTVDALRFRPNIVLANVLAHDEDSMDSLFIGNDEQNDTVVELKNVKPCTRCPIPNVDPTNALVDSIVTDTLLTYRRNPSMDDELTFGVNAIVIKGVGEVLRVGQFVGANYAF